MSQLRMFCFPEDDTILIKHPYKLLQDSPYLGHGTLVPKQYLLHCSWKFRTVRYITWRRDQKTLLLFHKWLYMQQLWNSDGQLPSNEHLIALSFIAGRLDCQTLHNDVINALQVSHLKNGWDACASVTCLDRWKEFTSQRSGVFWRKLHNFLVDRAAADMPMDCLIDNNLRKKMERALKCRKVLYEGRGKKFPPALMARYYLGPLPGDSFGNPIDISAAESMGSENVIDQCKPRLNFVYKLPIEIRCIIYEYVLITSPLKPGGPRFRGNRDKPVASLLQVCRQIYEEAKPVFRKNHFQIHALYGEELVEIIGSIGHKLTINWYPEVVWEEGVLEKLSENINLKELQLNFYPGSKFQGHRPSSYTAWFLFPNVNGKWEPCPGQGNLAYVPNHAPFLHKFTVLPGFQEILKLRGLEQVTCNFHPRILLNVLSSTDRSSFQVYINKTLTQLRTI